MSENTNEWRFRGFKSPRFTQTPNEIFDELLKPGLLTEAELRVLLYIVRRTFGFGKDNDAISIPQLTEGIIRQDGEHLDWGAGVGRPAATRAVKGLEAKGIIVAERSLARDGGNAATIYRLRMEGENQELPDGGSPKRPPGVLQRDPQEFSKDTPGGSPKIARGVSQRNPQKKAQNTVKQNIGTDAENFEINVLLVEPEQSDEPEDESTSPPASPWINAAIVDYSREFNQLATMTVSVNRAMRLWSFSGLGEHDFVGFLQQARDRTRKAQGRLKGAPDKMAVFFGELEALIERHLADQAESA